MNLYDAARFANWEGDLVLARVEAIIQFLDERPELWKDFCVGWCDKMKTAVLVQRNPEAPQ